MAVEQKQVANLEPDLAALSARLDALEPLGDLMGVTNTAVGTVNVSTALIPAPLDTVIYQRPGFSATLAGNVITFGEDIPHLKILMKVTLFQQTGTRSSHRGELIYNGNPLAGDDARPHGYIRTMGSDDGSGDMGFAVINNISSGDTLGLSAIRSTTQASNGRFTARGNGLWLVRLA